MVKFKIQISLIRSVLILRDSPVINLTGILNTNNQKNFCIETIINYSEFHMQFI